MDYSLNENSQNQPDLTRPELPKPKKIIPPWLGLILVILFALGAFAIVFAYQFYGDQLVKFLSITAGSPSQSQQATAGWKTYTNTEYSFEFKYPDKLFDKFYGPTENECSNRHPDTQKYANRFIFEADQEGIASRSISMDMTIICTKLEKSKVDNFIKDINLNGSDVEQRQISGKIAYQTTAYSALSAAESLHAFIDLGDKTLQISFYNPGLNRDVVDQIISTFKFTAPDQTADKPLINRN